MSQETIPPSDDDIFISTQIQGKLDEIEDEAKEKRIVDFLQQFANKAKSPPRVQRKQYHAKGKVKVKPRVKSKKLSITDQMIQKLSGKRQKLRQMLLRHDGELSSETASPKHQDQTSYDAVFTPKEWDNLRYVFNAGHGLKSYQIDDDKEDLSPKCEQKGLWDAASGSPEFDVDDWGQLYGYHDHCRVTRLESGLIPPITFSQLDKSSQRSIPADEDEKTIEEFMIKNGGKRTLDLHSSPSSAVSCSSDEGSVIEVIKRHRGTNDSPFVLCSQDSDTSADTPSPHFVEVRYKGPAKINAESQHCARMKVRHNSDTEEVINTSDDEEDKSCYIEIVQHGRRKKE